MLEKARNVLLLVALTVGIVVGVVVAVQTLSGGDDDDAGLDLPPADVPPLEYVYLDSARVLAYLGQVEQGLATTESRTFTEKRASSVGVKGETVVEVSRNLERQRQTEQVVTLTEADRFFTFLRILRRPEDNHRPLQNVDVQLKERRSFARLRSQVAQLREGDFVRIRNAQLSLPPFAAVYPRVRYVPYYRGGELLPPKRPLYAPMSEGERDDVVAYRGRLGSDPRLPFIVPTLAPRGAATPATRSETDVLSFLVPVKYSGLTPESGLLAGTVTIVGKVVYRDPRLPSEVRESDPVRPNYVDRQALASFGHALTEAPGSLLRDLGIPRSQVARKVSGALTIPAPVVLVLPLAIYQ